MVTDGILTEVFRQYAIGNQEMMAFEEKEPRNSNYTSIKNHFYKMKRDIGMADYEKQVKQEFHTPSLYLCFVIGA